MSFGPVIMHRGYEARSNDVQRLKREFAENQSSNCPALQPVHSGAHAEANNHDITKKKRKKHRETPITWNPCYRRSSDGYDKT